MTYQPDFLHNMCMWNKFL